VDDPDATSVSPPIRRAAAWSWRLLVIFAAVVVVFEVLRRFGVVVVPVALALALAALLLPAVDFLDRYGAARGGAVAFVVVMGLTAVVAILAFVVDQFVEGLPGLVDQVAQSIDSARDWQFVTQAVPEENRSRIREAGAAGFHSLAGYARATFLVALVDAAGIGIGLAIMGIPLALPLASLVFLGAFIPIVGAVLSGFLAVIVALLAKGFVFALITLGLVIAVQQLEAHVLQPLVMGRAVSLHPLAVVLGIGAGSVLAGIIGALLAVPTIAFFNSFVRVLLAPDPSARGEALEAEPGPLLDADVDQEP
jgi:putative heme transporter